jgi:hypothetical protein
MHEASRPGLAVAFVDAVHTENGSSSRMLLQMKMARYLPKQMFLIILLEPKLHNSN